MNTITLKDKIAFLQNKGFTSQTYGVFTSPFMDIKISVELMENHWDVIIRLFE